MDIGNRVGAFVGLAIVFALACAGLLLLGVSPDVIDDVFLYGLLALSLVVMFWPRRADDEEDP